MRNLLLIVTMTLCAAGCSSDALSTDVRVGTSLLGEPLYPMEQDAETRKRNLDLYRQAKTAQDAAPQREDRIIWLGRRQAYLGRYDMAIVTFSQGLQVHPESHRLLRHRGHRYITLRKLDRAVADLSRAATLVQGLRDEVEPDGQPNDKNRPRSTTQTNIFYHLGLAHYLRGEHGAALDAYRSCLERCDNDDMTVATLYWMTLTLNRLGEQTAVRDVLKSVERDMDVIENQDYHRLLLLFGDKLNPDDLAGADDDVASATVAYGLSCWHEMNGRHDEAQRLRREILEGGAWPAFGYIAAEADIACR